ncbi:LacI family DNA-binding transcriptional regulator [Leifsonia aquatica]|uniref:LacI family DNA-binding transcriptional regulator n=1 Tax=Leifsonia aquatica TaxID=144185 RepID=UPI0038067F93
MAIVKVRDVARMAGVSAGTVSNYLNHPHKVAAPTGRRIEQAIADLGYVTNPTARALRTGDSRIIGHLTYEVGDPFFSSFSRGVQDAATAAGYEVVIANSDGSAERETQLLRFFGAQKVSGLLLSPVVDRSSEIAAFARSHTPVVLLDKHRGPAECSTVSVDDTEGGMLAAEHLLRIGCTHLYFVGGPLDIDAVQDRWNGARRAVDAAATEVRLTQLPTAQRSIRAGREAAEQLASLVAGDEYAGIFAVNDLVAIGVLHGLLQRGIRVPEDVAIVGYDDIDFAEDAVVPLSTIRRPGARFGREAFDRLEDLLEGKPPTSTTFTPELIVRSSTSRAP